jgi:hypothetical protein
VTTKYAAGSLPQHAEKRALVVPARRAPLAVNSCNRRGIQVIGWSELATDQRDYIERRPRWGLVLAPFNNDFGKLEIGGAIGYRRDHADVIDEGSLHQRVKGRPRGLNFATALLETEDGIGAVIQYHAIRERDDREANHEARRMVSDYGLKLHAAGLPVVILPDTNDGQAFPAFEADGYSIGARGDVMGVFGLGIDWLGNPSAPDVDWSDHKAPARRGRPSSTQNKPRPPRRLLTP